MITGGEDILTPVSQAKAMADKQYPGRFLHYMNLDYAGWNDPDFAERWSRLVTGAAA